MTAQAEPSVRARLTVVLPVDDGASPGTGALTVLAPRLDSFGDRSIGVVDNGLWRSMTVVVDGIERALRRHGGAGLDRVPFDHLAADFAEHQRALVPFSKRIAGAVTGLGN